MLSFLRDLWRYTLTYIDNPLYARELGGWAYVGFFTRLQRGCLPIFVAIFMLTAACCGVYGFIGTVGQDLELYFVVLPYLILLMLYVCGEMVLFSVGFLITALTATAISSEIESQSYSLLRLTPFTPHEIVFTKFGAAMYQMRQAIGLVFFTRIGAIVGAVGYSAGLSVGALLLLSPNTSGATLPPPSPPTSLPVVPVDSILGGLTIILLGIIILGLIVALYVVEPTLRLSMFAAIGLVASALAKTRTNGLISAILVRIGYAVASYILVQMIQASATLGIAVISVTPGVVAFFEAQPVFAILLGMLFFIGALSARLLFPIAVTSLSLWVTERRAARLPYNLA